MQLKKLFNQWKQCHKNKNKYRFIWKPRFFVDDRNFQFFFIPTIGITPWWNLVPKANYDYLFEFVWLNFAIMIGKIEPKEE